MHSLSRGGTACGAWCGSSPVSTAITLILPSSGTWGQAPGSWLEYSCVYCKSLPSIFSGRVDTSDQRLERCGSYAWSDPINVV